jgi:DNA (cytosine-5)-methyltransferase 1
MCETPKIGIDIFSGAGGLSLGAIKAGIVIQVAIEIDENSAKTFKRNHPDSTVLMKDIRMIDPIELNTPEPFIIFGGPPCQGFSVSNLRTRTNENENNSLFKEFVRFVSQLKPKWFLFENVEGIVSFEKGEVVKEIVAIFTKLGYKVDWKVLNSVNYGVPQERNRFILVGNNLNLEFKFPEGNCSKVTVEEAIGDLPLLKNGESSESLPYESTGSMYAQKMRNGTKYSLQNFVSRNTDIVLERYKHINQGQNWKAIPSELMNNYKDRTRCHSGIYKRLKANKPSVVISNYRKNMLIHPHQNRGLSVREAARIQSFPDNFLFEGSLMHQQQQIGNAVPPMLAERLFQSIIEIDSLNGKPQI